MAHHVLVGPEPCGFPPNLSVPINKQPQHQTESSGGLFVLCMLTPRSDYWHYPHEAGVSRKDIILKDHHFFK